MTWLAMLLALFLEQMSFPGLRARVDGWLMAWPRWVLARARASQAGDWQRSAWAVLAVLAPAILAVWVQALLGAFLGWFWALLVLFAGLGFSRYIRTAAVLREVVEWRDEQALSQLVAGQVPEAAEVRGGLAAQALAASVMLAQRQVLAWAAAIVLGWMLGVPLFGVVLLVTAQAWQQALKAEATDDATATAHWSDAWLQRLDAAAALVTAVTLAVGGQFDAVLRALRASADGQRRKAMALLGDAAGAALGLPEDWMLTPREMDDEAAVSTEHLMRWDGLVWRALGVWLLVLALLTVLTW